MRRIGILGVGLLGGAVASRLLARGFEVVGYDTRHAQVAALGPLMVSHKFDPHIRLDLFLKDFGLMLDEARRLGLPLPPTSVAHQLCTATSAAGHGAEDLAAVITTLETLAGIGSPGMGSQ